MKKEKKPLSNVQSDVLTTTFNRSLGELASIERKVTEANLGLLGRIVLGDGKKPLECDLPLGVNDQSETCRRISLRTDQVAGYIPMVITSAGEGMRYLFPGQREIGGENGGIFSIENWVDSESLDLARKYFRQSWAVKFIRELKNRFSSTEQQQVSKETSIKSLMMLSEPFEGQVATALSALDVIPRLLLTSTHLERQIMEQDNMLGRLVRAYTDLANGGIPTRDEITRQEGIVGEVTARIMGAVESFSVDRDPSLLLKKDDFDRVAQEVKDLIEMQRKRGLSLPLVAFLSDQTINSLLQTQRFGRLLSLNRLGLLSALTVVANTAGSVGGIIDLCTDVLHKVLEEEYVETISSRGKAKLAGGFRAGVERLSDSVKKDADLSNPLSTMPSPRS